MKNLKWYKKSSFRQKTTQEMCFFRRNSHIFENFTGTFTGTLRELYGNFTGTFTGCLNAPLENFFNQDFSKSLSDDKYDHETLRKHFQ